jgi:hypothetical protein
MLIIVVLLLQDNIPLASKNDFSHQNPDSIRRYFERLTLLETIYEKLTMESNRKPSTLIDTRKLSPVRQDSIILDTSTYSDNDKQHESRQDIVSSRMSHASKTSGTFILRRNQHVDWFIFV